MPRGRGYDDDDLDDGYDDEAEYDEYDAAGAGAGAGAGSAGGSAEDAFPDGELLNATYDAVEAVVGATFGEAAIVAALRGPSPERGRHGK